MKRSHYDERDYAFGQAMLTLHGHLLASGGADRVVKVWEVEHGRCQQTLSGHTDLACVATAPTNGFQ